MDPTQRTLRPGLAVLLSLLMLGLGQLYNGQGPKAILVLCVAVMLGAGGPLLSFHTFLGFVVLLLLGFLFALAVHVDAFRSARSLGAGRPVWFSRWPLFVFAFLVHALLVPHVFRAISPVVAYQIPSGSMVPTVHPGDYFAAERINGEHKPIERGDLVVFEGPDTGETLMKRVIGLESERIQIHDTSVLVNGQALEEPYVSSRNPRSSRGSIPLQDSTGPVVVPSGSVFLLGDNRARSRDSRHFGPVPVRAIRARALYCYLSGTFERIGEPLNSPS